VLIDTDRSALQAAEGLREFTSVVGDGSSEVVLRRAGLENAAALVAAMFDDDRNLAALRIAREAGVLRIVGIAHDASRMEEYRDLGVPVVSADMLAARSVEVLIEPRRVISTTFAEGKAEALEFRIAADAPVRGKRIQELHAGSWVIAAVLRDDELIIPKGPTRLEVDDRVTVVGAAAEFPDIVNTFTSGESRFPLNFGRKVAVVLDSADDFDLAVGEAIDLVRNTPAEGLVVLHRDPETMAGGGERDGLGELLDELKARTDGIEMSSRPVAGSLEAALVALPATQSIGMLVTTLEPGTALWARRRIAAKVNRYGAAGVPVLLARGRHPYASVLVPARRTVAGDSAARAAIDIARTSSASLVGVSVVAASFVSGPEAIDDARESTAWLREEAAVQGVQVHRRVRRGNPVRVITELAGASSVLVISLPARGISTLRPDVAGHLLGRVGASVLLVPRSSG
jgi:Trk K+ transport system NAD-binding subunit